MSMTIDSATRAKQQAAIIPSSLAHTNDPAQASPISPRTPNLLSKWVENAQTQEQQRQHINRVLQAKLEQARARFAAD